MKELENKKMGLKLGIVNSGLIVLSEKGGNWNIE